MSCTVETTGNKLYSCVTWRQMAGVSFCGNYIWNTVLFIRTL